jgi:hypothetical protein
MCWKLSGLEIFSGLYNFFCSAPAATNKIKTDQLMFLLGVIDVSGFCTTQQYIHPTIHVTSQLKLQLYYQCLAGEHGANVVGNTLHVRSSKAVALI